MGASGDMLLGALLAAGADRSALAPVEAVLPVRYIVETVDRNGIEATTVSVQYTETAADEHGSHQSGTHEGGHDHAHAHDHESDQHDQGHSHGHEHDRGDGSHDNHAEGHGPTRTLDEIVAIVDEMALPPGVREDAVATFAVLAEAESRVHGTDLAATTVHEVGADDAIADVVGTALLLADLEIERVVVPPVNAGSGEVSMAHGTYPIPAPAVVEIARRADWSLAGGPVEGELLTPTGAALLSHFGEGVEALRALDVDAVGYGAGSRTYPHRPNVLRVLVGDGGRPETDGTAADEELALRREPIAVVETTVDDVTPEVLGSLHETLAEAGALDVAIAPVGMKKSRPGHVVQVIVAPTDARAVAARLARETGTLGVRVIDAAHRWVADRTVEPVTLTIDGETFEVGVKVGTDTGGVQYDASAEYDDAVAVATETGLAVREIVRRAEREIDETE
ncbi:Uncharacterized protein HSRCO_2774 [Halanaeroarchaeum sp. HSR-CO]|nr:Uncharacterized protein HSRCO_2774 [Halanaeroarchaeum sp. HSR-CO]